MNSNGRLTLLLVMTSSLLAACGGGSDENSPVSSGGGSGSSNTITLTATVLQDTMCDTQIPVTTAELLIYDSNWKITSRHKPDSQGSISATIPEVSLVNYSLIRSSGAGSDRKILVDTFAQHPTGDLGLFKVSAISSQGCECVQTDVRLVSASGQINYNVQLTGHNNGTDYIDSTWSNSQVTFDNRQICRQPDTEWPVLTAMANGSYDALAGQVKNYDPAQTIVINMDLESEIESISLNGNVPRAVYFYQMPRGSLSGAQEFPYDLATLFPDIETEATLSIRGSSTSISDVNNLSFTLGRSQRRGYELPLNQPLEITLPDSSAHQPLLSTLSDSLLSDSTRYDLSRVTDFNTFYTTTVITLTDGSQLDWFFIGPKTGSFPADPLPADYNIDNLIDEDGYFYVSMGMQRYGQVQTHQQYVRDLTERGRLPQHERLVGKWREFNHVYVSFQR